MSLKANLFAAALAVAAGFLATKPAHALYDPSVPGLTYTGLSYSSPFGSSHRSTVETVIETTLLPGSNAYFVGRIDDTLDQGETGAGSPVFANSLDAMCLDAGCTNGTWSFNPGLSNFVIAFVEISAGSNSYLFKLDNFALLGNWNTSGLGDVNKPLKELSHMDFYAIANTAGTSVPEPGVLLLLAMGLAGLAGIRFRGRPVAMAAAREISVVRS